MRESDAMYACRGGRGADRKTEGRQPKTSSLRQAQPNGPASTVRFEGKHSIPATSKAGLRGREAGPRALSAVPLTALLSFRFVATHGSDKV
jgi:hypothetical protein